jgi:Outer membrane protein beta-barrel domain
VLICTLLAALAPTRRACAAAGQWQAGARAGVAWLDGPGWGPSTEAFLRYGLGDSLDLDVQVLTSFHPFQQGAKLSSGMAANSSAEEPALPWAAGVAPALLYRWDVLRVIPYAGAGVGVYQSDARSSGWDGTQFGVSARAGVEYLLSRDVVLSAQLGAHLALTESPLPAPWIQLGVGAAYVWGW